MRVCGVGCRVSIFLVPENGLRARSGPPVDGITVMGSFPSPLSLTSSFLLPSYYHPHPPRRGSPYLIHSSPPGITQDEAGDPSASSGQTGGDASASASDAGEAPGDTKSVQTKLPVGRKVGPKPRAK
jgi:hypothetical protein